MNRFAPGQNPLPTELTPAAWETFDNFQGGYNSQDSREGTPPNSSSFALNTEVDLKDRIIRCPGTTPVETLAHAAAQVGLQASLDNRSELILFAPPYFGYKAAGATSWVNAGLPSAANRLYTWADYGGTLMFSNGVDKVFIREPESSLVSVATEAPLARTYASFAGRVFAGGALINGNYEPLGLAWTGTEGDPTNWSGLASGYELLINEMSSSGDRIVALRPMGLDWLAIICRRSIWVGRRTGVDIRPIDPQPRVGSTGAINEPVCQLTLGGVAFLSDSGVRIFDGNQAPIVSQQINNDLLPIDYTKINQYRASYNPRNNRYFLYTPTDTWVYDLDYQRWYRRSMLSLGGTIFAPQAAGLRWQDLIGSWGAQTSTWADFSPEEGSSIDNIFLSADGTKIAKLDSASTDFFGVAMTAPRWDFHYQRGQNLGEIWSVKDAYFEYEGAGTIAFYSMNNNAQLTIISTVQLDNAVVPTTVALPFIHSGLGAGISMQYTAGSPKISQVQVQLQKQTQRIEGVRPHPRT